MFIPFLSALTIPDNNNITPSLPHPPHLPTTPPLPPLPNKVNSQGQPKCHKFTFSFIWCGDWGSFCGRRGWRGRILAFLYAGRWLGDGLRLWEKTRKTEGVEKEREVSSESNILNDPAQACIVTQRACILIVLRLWKRTLGVPCVLPWLFITIYSSLCFYHVHWFDWRLVAADSGNCSDFEYWVTCLRC